LEAHSGLLLAGRCAWPAIFDTQHLEETHDRTRARSDRHRHRQLLHGSIDNATIVDAGDMLYVQSGYSMFGGMPGNVLIAYQLQKAEK